MPLIPRAVTPWLTAFRAYSVQRSSVSRVSFFVRVEGAIVFSTGGGRGWGVSFGRGQSVRRGGNIPICTSFPLQTRRGVLASRQTDRQTDQMGMRIA